MTNEERRTYSAWFDEVSSLQQDGYVRDGNVHYSYGYDFGRTIYLRHPRGRVASVFADFLQNIIEVSINGKLKKTIETCPTR